ncbi:MAG: ATP-binding protein [Chloroflexi bacterium]|nr:ATP-binding protein [Chloroflexota bacterium]
MGFRKASEIAKQSGRATKTTTTTGTPSSKREAAASRAAKPGTIACPDCAGREPDPSCARCDGSGLVCARCKGTGYVYRNGPDGAAEPAECACDKVARRRAAVLWPFLERNSSLRGDLLNKTFDNFRMRDGFADVRAALDGARAFARNPKGWLVLNGRPGVGKTHLSAAIANDLIARRQPVLFLNVPELLGFLRAGFNTGSGRDPDFDQRLQTIKSFPVLVLDDWGAHSDTPWADEQLYLILNYRTERTLPTVISSNIPLEDVEPRIRSRLLNRHLSRVVELLAPDFRLTD